MNILRFSAVEHLGVPIGSESIANNEVLKLMDRYGIDGHEVPPDTLEDITPYYWQLNNYTYYLHRDKAGDAVRVDFLPRYEDAETYALLPESEIAMVAVRSVVIPANSEVMAIAGPSPRYSGQICVHEVIASDTVG